MFKKILDAIAGLFSSLFGGKSKTTPKPTVKPTPTPIENIPEDGSEIKPDTIVLIANELDHVDVRPNAPDVEFEHDIFDQPETPVTPETPVVETPVVEPPVVDPPVVVEPPHTETPKPKGRFMWCLDNGHGKKTPGKRSPIFDDGTTQLFEYEFNRDIVRRIKEQLDKKGVKYFITVPEVDIDDFLEGRVNRANALQSDLPKIFVSIHSNAAPAATANSWAADSISGIETWFFHGSQRGQKLASIFQQHLVDNTGFKNRHLKSKPEGQFYVIRKTKMTAILTENGFYNNKKEAAELNKDAVRQKIADAHVAAILEVEENGL
ncbi:MAG TPA: N-acetylmuramoyl-L-alanine amidase [Flavilitoribacter sp.]|nr:N-acetylmuramoyl-L-alanine amidase [Flavilitoribacter sp.]HMQ90648.1 N-acetylmuramoyl-L-alanine amidase [Flavilitoribacter sp.]